MIKAQEQFSIIDQSTALGTDYKILLDNGATKSFMLKQYYLEINPFMDYQISSQRHKLFKLEMDRYLHSLHYFHHHNSPRSYV